MRKTLAITLAVLLVLGSTLLGAQATPASAGAHTILSFGTMVGIPQGLTGVQNPIRGINGGGLPWMLTSANGSLKDDGALKIEVEGLVLAAGTNAGRNPISSFRAIVSCELSNGTFQNLITDPFPATIGSALTGGGDAEIETTVSLPQPCIAPIIFVTSPGGAWFAATGK